VPASIVNLPQRLVHVSSGFVHWQDTRWIKTLAGIASRIQSNREDGHAEEGLQELNHAIFLPPGDSSIMPWLQGLASSNVGTLEGAQDFSAFTTAHAQGKKVLLVPCAISVNDTDMSLFRVVALLQKFGPFPPNPTAIFPCDCSTTSSAISEFTWRLKTASNILDEGSDAGIALRLESIFLCHITKSHPGVIVVTRPDTLRPQDQDVLLDGLGKQSLRKNFHVLLI
jgi:hypothetical protein